MQLPRQVCVALLPALAGSSERSLANDSRHGLERCLKAGDAGRHVASRQASLQSDIGSTCTSLSFEVKQGSTCESGWTSWATGCRCGCSCKFWQTCWRKIRGEVDVGECAASALAQVLLSFALLGAITLILVIIRLIAMRRQLREELLDRLEEKEKEASIAAAMDHEAHVVKNQDASGAADVSTPAEGGSDHDDETH
uniref:Transmembrane protein n=1 Tax=Zooxanthella nutricula TaxID=1333877 RepID=A0A7S2NZJ9_9DINO